MNGDGSSLLRIIRRSSYWTKPWRGTLPCGLRYVTRWWSRRRPARPSAPDGVGDEQPRRGRRRMVKDWRNPQSSRQPAHPTRATAGTCIPTGSHRSPLSSSAKSLVGVRRRRRKCWCPHGRLCRPSKSSPYRPIDTPQSYRSAVNYWRVSPVVRPVHVQPERRGGDRRIVGDERRVPPQTVNRSVEPRAGLSPVRRLGRPGRVHRRSSPPGTWHPSPALTPSPRMQRSRTCRRHLGRPHRERSVR